MKFFIFRNSTVEHLFSKFESSFSNYDDITCIPPNAENYIWFYLLPYKSDLQVLKNEINAYFDNLEYIAKQIPRAKNFYIFTIANIFVNIIETGDFTLQQSINRFNDGIINLAAANGNIKVIDFQSFISCYPTEQLTDWKYYYLSKMILNPKLAGAFQEWIVDQLDVMVKQRKKCIVLDLDNTLWGGILGEDGNNGIKIGGEYPGNAFLDFQKSLLELHNAGVLLTICSKNNEEDVIEVWNKNPYIIIKKEHIAAHRINWNNKAQNIAELVKQLNIGADSIVFIDDNPSERALVKQLLPMVETPNFPSQPYKLPIFVKDIIERYFKIYQLTNEDKIKTKQYQENEAREELQNKFSDFTEYLTSLSIMINLQEATELTVPRLAQMTQKTNQFNLTTKRYTESDIYSFIENGHWVYSINVSDRFGDNGISGLIIIKLNNEKKTADIETFLLSCRVLGKGIEEAFLYTMINKLKNNGIYEVHATYLRTAKNDQVKYFYEKLGFVLNSSPEFYNEDHKIYYLSLIDKVFEVKPFYKMNDGN